MESKIVKFHLFKILGVITLIITKQGCMGKKNLIYSLTTFCGGASENLIEFIESRIEFN